MKLSILVGMALIGAFARIPDPVTEDVPILNEAGDVMLDVVTVEHLVDAGGLHISRSHMLAADISCVSVVYLPSTTFQSCSVEIQK
jgi:hypothetical protein